MSKRTITNARARGLTIGELSGRTGVHIETIRYYEKAGMLPAPPRTPGGRRIYGLREERTLTFIRRARELGFTSEAVRGLLALGETGTATCAEVRIIAVRHLEDIRAKVADLRKLERLLSKTVARCSGDQVPECAVLNVLYPRRIDVNAGLEGAGRAP